MGLTLSFCLGLHFNRTPVGQARINPRCDTSICFGFAEVGLVSQSTDEHRAFEIQAPP